MGVTTMRACQGVFETFATFIRQTLGGSLGQVGCILLLFG
jgi:hypothetical protein